MSGKFPEGMSFVSNGLYGQQIRELEYFVSIPSLFSYLIPTNDEPIRKGGCKSDIFCLSPLTSDLIFSQSTFRQDI
jgi:hypothetical protein